MRPFDEAQDRVRALAAKFMKRSGNLHYLRYLMKITKNRFVAVVLSIFLPGSGQVLKGHGYKTMIGYSIFFLLPILFFATQMQYHFWGLVLFVVFLLFLYVLNIVDAAWRKNEDKQSWSKRFSKWLVFIPVILFTVDAYAVKQHLSTGNPFIGVRAFKLFTGSMAPTMQIGDYLMFDMGYYDNNTIERGDLIFFHHKQFNWISKRVIAVAGDSIRGENNQIFLNGKPIHEPYAQFIGREQNLDSFNEAHSTTDFELIVVPQGKLFVIGDNRDNSYDSRDPSFGLIQIENVIGKPIYVFWARDKSRIGKILE